MIRDIDENITTPAGITGFSHSNLFHPAIIDAVEKDNAQKTPMSSGKTPQFIGDPIEDEMKILNKRNFSYDNKPVRDVVKSAATKMNINPALLYSSAFQEGMNKAITHPDDISEALDKSDVSPDYPVDGFYNYGLDKFGDRYKQLKQYLPKDFDKEFQVYQAKNEKGQTVNTAAFKTNEDALIATGAFMRMNQDEVKDYAKSKGVDLNDKALNYFTLAAYNGGFDENAKHMIDEYAKADDKDKFIDSGATSRKGVHKNIYPRLHRMSVANELLNQQ